MSALDILAVLAGVTVLVALFLAAWYAVGWMIGLFLRFFPLAGPGRREGRTAIETTSSKLRRR